jgi:hypothetical protein
MSSVHPFDLQIQSIASDGKHTPSEVVEMAKEEGVGTIALTDHDTVAGVLEAEKKGKELGIRVIRGIEMSVEEHNIHILGYGINPLDSKLMSSLEEFQKSRVEGAKKIVENLRANEGLVVQWEDVLKEAKDSDSITRPHIVSAVMKRPENKAKLEADGVRDKNGFFEKYLSDRSPNFVSRAHVSARDGIDLIHASGGVAIWSHPVVPDFVKGAYDELEKFFQELVEWGIDGLEVFSSAHNEDSAEFLYGLLERYKLLKTGGSDFHERKDHERFQGGLHSADRIGDFETYGFPTDDILPQLLEAIEKHSR